MVFAPWNCPQLSQSIGVGVLIGRGQEGLLAQTLVLPAALCASIEMQLARYLAKK